MVSDGWDHRTKPPTHGSTTKSYKIEGGSTVQLGSPSCSLSLLCLTSNYQRFLL